MSWFSIEETKPKTTKATNTRTKQPQLKQKKNIQKAELMPKPIINCNNCSRVCMTD